MITPAGSSPDPQPPHVPEIVFDPAAHAPQAAATAAATPAPKETPDEREDRLWRTVGVPSEEFDKAVSQYGTVVNPERRTPEFMMEDDFVWPYDAGAQATKITPDTHGGVGLFTAVNDAAHDAIDIATEINDGDMIDKSLPAGDAYRANVGDLLSTVLALPETHGVKLITIPGNHEDALFALTAPAFARSLDGFSDQQIQTLRDGSPRDEALLQTHALVVMSRDRYAGKTFPEMGIDVASEMAALKPYVQTVDGKKGWVAPPPELAQQLYQTLQSKVLSGLQQFDPAVYSYFTQQQPAYIRVGDYLVAHAGVRPNVPLEQQTPYDPMWVRLPFTRQPPHGLGGPVVAGHNIHAYPTVHLGIDRTGQQDANRVFDVGTKPAAGGGVFTGARFQIDTGTGATHWDQHTQLVIGPDDRVRFIIKPKDENRVMVLDLKDAVNQGYVKLNLHVRNGDA